MAKNPKPKSPNDESGKRFIPSGREIATMFRHDNQKVNSAVNNAPPEHIFGTHKLVDVSIPRHFRRKST